jgi:starch phosphorylase
VTTEQFLAEVCKKTSILGPSDPVTADESVNVCVVRAIRRFTVRTVLPASLSALEELALNLRWSWHPPTRDLFAAIDPGVWRACGEDPVRLLGEVSAERLAELAGDHGFVDWVERTRADLHAYLQSSRWFQTLGPDAPVGIAYFSPEYGITSALPQYSGGLGILAGDHLKTASDLGVPIIALGLFYRAGYFRQTLSRDAWQQEHYPVSDPDGSPVSLLREADGTPAKIAVGLPGSRTLTARIWVAQVGRVPLLMLDSDVEENAPAEREVTDRLYGGGGEHRLQQEMLLGIGGIRALRAYCRITGCPAPEVFHTNEGHAGFLGLERIRELAAENPGMGFDEALEITRASTVFTTHTPVPAGIDRFPIDLIEQYFGGENASDGVPVERVLDLGAERFEGGDPGVFNMAVMGLRLGQRANGVSLLHGAVSRGMFAGLWPGFDSADVPITSVTNGVHAPTWTAREVVDLAGGVSIDDPDGWGVIADTPDHELWRVKRALREELVLMTRVVEAPRRLRGRTRLDRHRARSRCPHDRLRTSRALLQAPDADAARSRSAQEPADASGSTGAAGHRRQVPPGRRRRQAPDPAARAVLRRGGCPAPHRVPARLRHVDGDDALPGVRRMAEQPDPPAGGQRHLGNEGSAERCPEPVDPRRLVGRVVRRRERMGDSHR